MWHKVEELDLALVRTALMRRAVQPNCKGDPWLPTMLHFWCTSVWWGWLLLRALSPATLVRPQEEPGPLCYYDCAGLAGEIPVMKVICANSHGPCSLQCGCALSAPLQKVSDNLL